MKLIQILKRTSSNSKYYKYYTPSPIINYKQLLDLIEYPSYFIDPNQPNFVDTLVKIIESKAQKLEDKIHFKNNMNGDIVSELNIRTYLFEDNYLIKIKILTKYDLPYIPDVSTEKKKIKVETRAITSHTDLEKYLNISHFDGSYNFKEINLFMN